jgi:hypothetical protein
MGEEGVRGPCKNCGSWSPKITKAQRNAIDSTVRDVRCEGHGWCSEMKYPTRAIDGCDSRPIGEIFKMMKKRRSAR